MPDQDTSEWQPPEKIAELVVGWTQGENRPENGSFAKLKYQARTIVPEFM